MSRRGKPTVGVVGQSLNLLLRMLTGQVGHLISPSLCPRAYDPSESLALSLASCPSPHTCPRLIWKGMIPCPAGAGWHPEDLPVRMAAFAASVLRKQLFPSSWLLLSHDAQSRPVDSASGVGAGAWRAQHVNQSVSPRAGKVSLCGHPRCPGQGRQG